MKNNDPSDITINPSDLLTINTSFTKPDVLFHWIEDGDLEKIMKINSPKSALISTTCLGYLLGEARTIIDLVKKIASGDYLMINGSDLIYYLLIALIFGTFIVTTINTFRGESEIEKILEKIRSRPAVSLPNGFNHS